MPKLFKLDDEAENEVYLLIDKHYKKLPKKNDKTINQDADGFQHNDIDALRHAYVSGVYTMEYNDTIANILGLCLELYPLSIVGSSDAILNSINMDLWNNKIGRKYGKKSKTRKELFLHLLEALKKRELIIDLDDSREYKYLKNTYVKKNRQGLVIVLEENEKGENITFLDIEKKLILSKDEFISGIKNEVYKNYELRNIKGRETPVSKKDGLHFNNLG